MKLNIDSFIAFSWIHCIPPLYELFFIQHFKRHKFFFKFSFCVHYHLEKSHLLHVFVFIWGLIPVQTQILLNLQLIPGFTDGHPGLWVAMNNSSCIILTSKIFIYQWIEYCRKIFFIQLCYNIMPCKTVSPIQQPSNQRSQRKKSHVRLGPSTGCVAELSLTDLENHFVFLIPL